MLTSKLHPYLLALVLILVPLYPKFPLLGVSGTFVAIRLEDLIIAAVYLFWLYFRFTRLPSLLRLPVHRSILVFLFIGFVATFSGVFLIKSASLNLGLLHLFRRFEYLGLFFVAFDFFPGKTRTGFIIRVILATSGLVALYGLGQQFLNLPVISTTNSEFSKGLALSLGAGARINSTFAGHYDLAAYSVLPLLLILTLLTIPRQPKVFMLAIAFPIYWALLLSASRITFASFFICAAGVLFVTRRKLWLIPLSLLALLSIFLSPQLRGRYLDFFTNHLKLGRIVSIAHAAAPSRDVNQTPDALKPSAQPEDRSFNIRLKAEWPRAVRSFLKNPPLGTGYSSVGLAVDNDYFRLLAETGSLGLLAFGLIILRFYKDMFFTLRHYQPTVETAFITTVAFWLLSLLLNAIFIDVFEASKIAVIAWAIMGMAVKLAETSK